MAVAGYPTLITKTSTNTYVSIGLAQKNKTGTEAGYPQLITKTSTNTYWNMGVAQKDPSSGTTWTRRARATERGGSGTLTGPGIY